MQQNFYAWQVIAIVSSMLFTNFLQSVLFLKALLSVIEGGHDFAYYAKTVLAFAGISLLSECIMCISDYKGLVIQKDTFKAILSMIFKKAAEADISCSRGPWNSTTNTKEQQKYLQAVIS